MTAAVAHAPAWARALMRRWQVVEGGIAALAFGFIAVVLIVDVLGRELVGPVVQALDIQAATGLFGSQKVAVYAMVIGSFAGIGIATATASQLVPRIGFGWVPRAWGPAVDRLGDLLTALFMVGVAWVGLLFVQSSMAVGLRTQAIDWPLWPIQLAIPLGFLSPAVRYFFYAIWPALRPALPEYQE